MTERVLGPTGGRRRKRLAFFVPFLALVALILAIAAAAGPVGTASGFEDDDGNLILNGSAPTMDWNSFDQTTWTGTEPTRLSEKAVSGWSFEGAEDFQSTTSDSGFAGGTKQDDNCPSVITAKAPNKDDLKRFYMASKTGSDGHTYLNLAWVRIPQNTTSPSAHVGFEFNKANAGNCATGGLAQRVAGDMLIVYDFEGGTDIPTLTLRRWATSGTCEISNNSPPCWGPATTLTSGTAEARVNTGATALDTIAPTDETLGIKEFGEAGIDLTNAGVFTPGVCESFGRAYAVSRSSGSSGTAQMKDLAGPVSFNLTNCGQIKIIKRTNPRGVNQSFGFDSTIPAASTCVQDTTPSGAGSPDFSLNDSGNTSSDNAANTEDCTNVPAGTYTVTEAADPTGFSFNNYSCNSSGTGTSTTTGATARQVSITIAGGGVVTCVFTNDQNLGAIKVTKTRKNASAASNPLTQPHANVNFTVNGVTKATNSSGIACFDGLAFGTYSVSETVPAGYVADGDNPKSVLVDNNADCDDTTYVGESVSFGNTPLTDLSIDVDADDPGTTKSTVSCVDSNGDPVGTAISTPADPANFDANDLLPDTYTCTIFVDP